MEDVGKILVVCANADSPNNRSDTGDLLKSLIEEKLLLDKPYELIAVNPAEVHREVVYDSYIKDSFGSKDFEEKWGKGGFDAIFFQGCMSAEPFDIGSISIYYPKETIPSIKNLLKKGGLFLNREKGYNRGDGVSIKDTVSKYLQFVQKLRYYNSRFPRGAVHLIWDVWSKSESF